MMMACDVLSCRLRGGGVWLAIRLLALGVGEAAAQGRIVVGANVMVSVGSRGSEHGEYVADAHPTDPSRVMVCTQWFAQARNRRASGVYVSFDGGRTWSLSHEGSTRFRAADPACAYGLNGQAFFATLIWPDTAQTDSTRYDEHQWWRMGGDNRMPVFRSNDNGRTWRDTVLLPLLDFETLTVDRTTSPYRGRMYLYGNLSGGAPEVGLWLIYSADSGRTWRRSEFTRGTMHFPRGGTVLPTGTLVLPYTTSIFDAGTIAVSTTTDGGVHLSRPITVAARQHRTCSVRGGAKAASDHSTGPFRGRTYMVWADGYRRRCSVYLSHSVDDGKTWSERVRVSDERPTRAGIRDTLRFTTDPGRGDPMPQVAVSPTGVVGITWYGAADDREDDGVRLRFSASLDGGETWLPSVPVSKHGLVGKPTPEFAAWTQTEGGGVRRGGRTDEVDVIVRPADIAVDYTGIAVAADSVFHVFWLDNRSGVRELYTARVTVEGTAAKPEADLAGLANLTSAVEVQFTSSVWNARTRTMSWQYQLLNTSKDTIMGPLKIRIAPLESELGVPTLLLEAGRSGWAGTIIDLSPALAGGCLPPGQATPPQQLRVRLDGLREMLVPVESDLVHMQVKVYGRRTSTATARTP